VTCRPAKELVLSKEKPIPYQPPLPPNEAPSGVDAAAGVTPVGLRPPFVTPAAAHSHPDCRGIPIQIVAPHLASTEFTQLNQDQKDAFSDTAVVVKEEASKSTPDVGKLKRWGTRLVDLSKDIGMKVAAGEIVHLLNSMFGG
jgi:hypothetical protein